MKRRYNDLSPDEVFAEASNVSHFDEAQLEGRLETPISERTFLILGIAVAVLMVIFGARLLYLQVMQGNVYAQISENNSLMHVPVFAERGVMYDRNGVRLAWNAMNPETDEFSLRTYASTTGIAHVLGYASPPAKDSSGFYYQYNYVGKAGAEEVYDERLRGQNGTKILETNALSEILSESVTQMPEAGEHIYLSIDTRIQEKTYEIIQDLAEDVGFSGGAAAIMDVTTGELISLVSYPEYDNRAFASGDDEKIRAALTDDDEPLLNRVVSGLYTPGSIVKPVVALGALNEGIIDPHKQIESTGRLAVPNRYNPDNPTVFTDWKAHGWVDMSQALAISSNIYMYHIGGGFGSQEGLGINRIEKYMRLFGFGEPTGIILGSEPEGTIPTPSWKEEVFDDDWRIGDTYNTSIGQYGSQVTPLQAVRAVAALANKGTLLTPRIERTGEGSVEGRDIPIPQEYFNEIHAGMREAVTDGTSKGLNVSFMEVAGKTGTAELGITKSRVNAWSTGFFPYDDPQYAFVVLMQEGPRENVIGGVYVMRTLFDWMKEHTPEYFQDLD